MRIVRSLITIGALLALPVLAAPAQAQESSYKFSALLSLRGNCTASKVDPVPDPSCAGEPLAYPPPPDRPQQFERPGGIALDAFGNEYVYDSGTGSVGDERINVFDDEGKYITKIGVVNDLIAFNGEKVNSGADIDIDSKGNVYVLLTAAPPFNLKRYSPSTYDPEARAIEYTSPPTEVKHSFSKTGYISGDVAVDASNDHLFAVGGGTIVEFASASEGNGMLESFVATGFGSSTEMLAVDAQRRRILVSDCTEDCFVSVFEADAPHSKLEEIDGSSTPVGKFIQLGGLPIAVDEESGDYFIADPAVKRVYQFDVGYAYRSQIEHDTFMANGSIDVSNGENAAGDAFNRHYLFVTTYENGRALAFEPPGVLLPEVEVSLTSVSETEATLQAEVVPNGGDTDYSIEYTTQAAFETEEFTDAQLVGEGTVPGAGLPKQVVVPLSGLMPGTAYRFRVLAENEAGKAEPTAEAGFTTFEDALVADDCPNQALRVGSSAALPDCRAYELVTPPDTNGRPPLGVGYLGNLFPTLHASPAGDAVSFKIRGGSLPGSTGIGSFEGEPYVSRRGAAGWTTELAGASGSEATGSVVASTSPDQGYSFWYAFGEGPLVIDARATQYLYYPDGHSELIGRGSLGTDPVAEGRLITEGGDHVIFDTANRSTTAPVQLEPDAPPTGTPAVYDRTIDPETGEEKTHVVSLLPGDVPLTSGAGYAGASKDGEGIAFASGGTLYLRKGNAITYEIGQKVTFAGVSEGGARAFYVEGGNLKAFDTATEEVIGFSDTGDVTPVNVASDGARAYFVSPSVLGGANPQGDNAQPGAQNLYLSEEGQVSFVAMVTDGDVTGEENLGGLGLWTQALSRPAIDPSRTTPDGSVLLFRSRASLTGHDTGGSPQVYRYDSAAGTLTCISCVPTGAPAGDGATIQSYSLEALLPPSFSDSGFVPGLTPDGRRAFFESTEALVSTDTDGMRDVYEWEAQGMGNCKEAGGCVYLISSGNSAQDDFLYAHSTDGSDVFFTSADQLVGEDTSATVSIYDARVNGGFASSTVTGECLGEACQPASRGPAESVLSSSAFRGPGNLSSVPAKSRCAKPRRKVRRAGKVRCVKPKRGTRQRQRSAAKKRRAGR